jgi:hypothetical protein
VPAAGTRAPGELWTNFPDLQLGVIDATKTAQKLIAVRYFSASAAYAAGDVVVQAGAIWIANAAVPAGAFNASNWNQIALASALSGYAPLAGATFTGPVTLPAGSTVAGYLPLAGGTLSGPLTLPAGPPTLGPQAANKAYVDASISQPSTTAPLMDGTAAVGTGTAYARADHVHPSDTSLYPASNPSGFQTAAQVTASLGAYVKKAGDTMTGNLSIAPASGAATLTLNGTSAGGGGVLVLNHPAGGGNNNYISGQVGGQNRWVMELGNSTAESGGASGHTGSDFALSAFDNSGTNLGGMFTIARATGMATFATTVYSGGQVRAATNHTSEDPSQPTFLMQTNAGVAQAQCYYNYSANAVGLWHAAGGGKTALLYSYDQFQTHTFYNTTATAYLNGGTLWSNSSDARIKTVFDAYKTGLKAILSLPDPVYYAYKGNDTFDERLHDIDAGTKRDIRSTSAPYPASTHFNVAGQKFVGFVAQEVEKAWPELVKRRKGFIDGKEFDDVRDVNLSPMIYAMVNAIKELTSRLEAAEATLATIKAL